MKWEDIQDVIDKWAMEELPGEDASEARGCIMSWSDLIAQAIAARMEAATDDLEKFVAAHALERKQKLAAVAALEEIRRLVSDGLLADSARKRRLIEWGGNKNDDFWESFERMKTESGPLAKYP